MQQKNLQAALKARSAKADARYLHMELVKVVKHHLDSHWPRLFQSAQPASPEPIWLLALVEFMVPLAVRPALRSVSKQDGRCMMKLQVVLR